MSWYTRGTDSVTLTVRVQPGSSASRVEGVREGMLRVRLNAPPVDGAANEELVKLLSKEWRIAKSDIVILSGQTGRQKRLCLPLTPQGEQKLKEWDETPDR